MFGCVVCDECEATWTDPTLTKRFLQPSIEHPVCPHCQSPIWSRSSRWADDVDLTMLGWYSQPMMDI